MSEKPSSDSKRADDFAVKYFGPHDSKDKPQFKEMLALAFSEARREQREKDAKIAENKKFDRFYECADCGECRITHNGCKEIAEAIRREGVGG